MFDYYRETYIPKMAPLPKGISLLKKLLMKSDQYHYSKMCLSAMDGPEKQVLYSAIIPTEVMLLMFSIFSPSGIQEVESRTIGTVQRAL